MKNFEDMTEEEKQELSEEVRSVLKALTKDEEEKLRAKFGIENERPWPNRKRHRILGR
jgi:hypothetical protein